MTIQKIKSGRVNTVDADQYIGEKGIIFYNEDLGDLRLSDGVTLGGKDLTLKLPLASPTSPGVIKIGSGLVIDPSGTVSVTSSVDLEAVQTNIIPAEDNVYNLGSPTKRWKSVYVSTDSLYLDGNQLSVNNLGQLTFNGLPVGANISYNDLLDKPSLATVAYSGDYNDLINKPSTTIASANTLGSVKIGLNINVTQTGVISVPFATTTKAGVVKAGTNTSIAADGTISVPKGAGINKVTDIPDVYSTDLISGDLLIYNAGAQRWDTSNLLNLQNVDAGEY